MNQLTLFDYQQLDTETRIVVQQRTGEIKALMKRTAQDIIEIGQKLIEVKERLPHGSFGPWLESEFGWSWSTANNFMRVASKFATVTNLEDFSAKALYLLAAPSTPDEVRQEFVSRTQNGHPVTYSAVKGATKNGFPKTDAPPPDDNRPLFADDPHLDEALTDEDKPICPDCGQVYDGDQCPDCRPYNYKRDSRRTTAPDIYTPQGMDACQTPAYAIDPLLPYLSRDWTIWEPARGEGYLEGALYDSGFGSVVSGDILTGQNFFDYEPREWDCQVTNPPYSIQFQWLERSYKLGNPFALLLKVEVLGTITAHDLMKEYGYELLLLNRRIDFKMPFKGWDSSAQFPVFWLCWQLLPEQVILGNVDKSNFTPYEVNQCYTTS